MKKVIFICPYFGKLPMQQIKIWLKTCELNPKINWLIITDDETKYNYPKNVKVMYMTFNDIKEYIQNKFNFKICLSSTYKLCDFKPTYGYVFQELIRDYDYWGHCDLSDSIFGSFEDTLFNIINDDYEKIGFLGHLTLYKNTQEVNERIFLTSNSNKKLHDILGVPNNMAFDETYKYSINYIYIDNGLKIKRIDDLYVDISPKSYSFRYALWNDLFERIGLSQKKYIIEWNNGKLYKLSIENNKICKEEILYVHYQKRNMKIEIDVENISHFYIVPNKFIEFSFINNKIIKKYTRDKIINTTMIKIRLKQIKNKFKKINKGEC